VSAEAEGEFSLERVTFSANVATDGGGAIEYGSWGVGYVSLEDCIADGNEGPSGAAYMFSVAGDHKIAGSVSIVGGSITANGLASGTYGALYSDDWWQISVKDVDFGEGATDNDVDVYGCSKSYGAKSSFSYAPGLDIYCE